LLLLLLFDLLSFMGTCLKSSVFYGKKITTSRQMASSLISIKINQKTCTKMSHYGTNIKMQRHIDSCQLNLKE